MNLLLGAKVILDKDRRSAVSEGVIVETGNIKNGVVWVLKSSGNVVLYSIYNIQISSEDVNRIYLKKKMNLLLGAEVLGNSDGYNNVTGVVVGTENVGNGVLWVLKPSGRVVWNDIDCIKISKEDVDRIYLQKDEIQIQDEILSRAEIIDI